MQFNNDCCYPLLHFFKTFQRLLRRSSILVKLQAVTYKFILKNEPLYIYFTTAAFSFLLFHFPYYNCIVCTPHFCSEGGGWGLGVQPNFEKGGLDRTSTFRGGCWERGAWFFSEGFQLWHKKDKMVLRMKYFKILGVHWKIWLIVRGGRGHEKPI